MWICPNCSFVVTQEIRVWPVHCACGHADYGQGACKTDGSRVGRALHLLLLQDGFRPDESCGCKSMAAEMDARGLEWCKANREKIVNMMVQEAQRRGSMFPQAVLRHAGRRYAKAATKIGEKRGHK